jgi:hypothetical protein
VPLPVSCILCAVRVLIGADIVFLSLVFYLEYLAEAKSADAVLPNAQPVRPFS